MSRHQRKTDSGNTRSRIVLGSAMTAVFLSGGAGVAMASEHGHDRGQDGTSNSQGYAKGGDSSNRSKGGFVGSVLGGVLSNNTGQALSNNSFGNGNLNGLDINILSHQDKDKKHGGWKHEDKDEHKGGKHHWVDRDRDGCDDEDGHRWSDRDHDGRDDCDEDDKGTDCDEPEAKDDEKKDEDTKDEAKDEAKDEDTKDEKKDDVAADKSDDSTPKVENVASTSTEPGATPVGAADTGDGSFVGGVQPAASSWSMGDTMLAAGGGLAAAGLLAGAGVGMGRHRRTSHRHSA